MTTNIDLLTRLAIKARLIGELDTKALSLRDTDEAIVVGYLRGLMDAEDAPGEKPQLSEEQEEQPWMERILGRLALPRRG